MKRSLSLAAFTTMLVGSTLVATAVLADEKGEESGNRSVAARPSILDEDILMRFFEEPDAHFHKARERFFKKDRDGAADAIRTAAGFVNLEAMVATKEGEEMVRKSAAELDRLADGVSAGSVHSAKELDAAFARAHYAMGRNHNRKAIEHLLANRTQQAGQQLRAAVHHAEHGLQWAGVQAKDDEMAVFKQAAELAARLRTRMQAVKSAASAPVDRLSDIIEMLGRQARFKEELMQNR